MTDRFQGWSEEAQRFFIGLELDNSKRYFEANRAVYERQVRGPMLALLGAVEEEFGPGRVFRINRDVRFSADKSPYKTNVAAMAGREGRGGYVSLDARGLFVGSGRYRLEPAELARFRQAVADDRSGPELEEIVTGLEGRGYEIGGEMLKVVPRPHPRDHPRTRLLRQKGMYAYRAYGLQPWLGTPAALERVVEVWRDAQPLLAWFRSQVDGPAEDA
ncbi:MAG TPA: DUF2461 domain-containing protein [Methylomirabilota bacterium]|nr:DUF2461 domain-containing protein [Methylomirabilota bacterium]